MKLIYGHGELIKICAKCQLPTAGEMWEILKAYGRNRRRSDGLQVWCRKCRKAAPRLRNAAPAVRAEREACARIAEVWGAEAVATAIRAQG